jgi:hypothetical protein
MATSIAQRRRATLASLASSVGSFSITAKRSASACRAQTRAFAIRQRVATPPSVTTMRFRPNAVAIVPTVKRAVSRRVSVAASDTTDASSSIPRGPDRRRHCRQGSAIMGDECATICRLRLIERAVVGADGLPRPCAQTRPALARARLHRARLLHNAAAVGAAGGEGADVVR